MSDRKGREMRERRTRLTESTDDNIPVIKLPEAISLSDLGFMVAEAFRKQFQPPDQFWMVEVFSDFLICEKEGNKFKVGYEIKEGEPVFDFDFEQVEVEFTPVVESENGSFRESKDEVLFGSIREAEGEGDELGWRWRVDIIKAGHTKPRTMANGETFVRDYPIKVLEESMGIFEGVPVFAFSAQDHAPSPGNKGPRDEVGFIENVARKGNRIEGDLVIHRDADWLRQRMLGLRESGNLERGGLSIDAEGSGEMVKEGGINIFRVSELTKADSVDVVTSPAAGGQFRRLVASADAVDDVTILEEGATVMNLEQILALIESNRPELLEGVDREKLTIEQAQDLLTESMKPKTVEVEKIVEKEVVKESADAPKAATAEDIAKLNESLVSVQNTQAQTLCESILTASLSAAKLPAAVQASIQKRFTGTIFEADDLKEAIEDGAKIVEGLASDMPASFGVSVEVTHDEKEKKIHALEAMFWGGPNDKTHENFPDELKGVTPYRSFLGAYKDFTGHHDAGPVEIFSETARALPAYPTEGESARYRESVLKESMTTGSWTQVLGDSIRRRMIREYSMQGRQDWRKIVSDISNVPDFRTNRRMRVGGYGTLSTVAEQDTYPTLTSPTDEEETYAVAKRGGLEDITFEMVKNDDVGQIRRIPVKLGRAAANTLYRQVFDHLEDNDTLADAVALCHSSHSNDINAALSNASMTTGRRMLLDQTAYNDSAEILGIANAPRYVIVPHELDETSWQLLDGWGRGQGEHDTTNRNANFHGYQGLERIVVDYFSVATDWWMCADPANQPTIEVGFLDGQEDPEIFVQDAPNVGSVFTADKISYKVRHIYGSVPLDYRWIAGHQA